MSDDGWETVPIKSKVKKANVRPVSSTKSLNAVTSSKKKMWAAEQQQFAQDLIETDVSSFSFLENGVEKVIGSGNDVKPLKYIGGIDISFIKNNEVDACASFVVLSFPQLDVVFEKLKMIELKEPYIPGFLAFRECPPLVNLIKECLNNPRCPKPDILLADGNGGLKKLFKYFTQFVNIFL